MRVATVFVQRLGLGNANLTYLARDIASTLAAPPVSQVNDVRPEEMTIFFRAQCHMQQHAQCDEK